MQFRQIFFFSYTVFTLYFSPFCLHGQEITMDTGIVRSYGGNGNLNAELGAYGAEYSFPNKENFGILTLYDSIGNNLVELFVGNPPFDYGILRLFSPERKSLNVILDSRGDHRGNGFVGVFDTSWTSKAYMGIHTEKFYGNVVTDGLNDNPNTVAGGWSPALPNNGVFIALDENGDLQAFMGVDGNGDGVISADIKNFRTDHPIDQGKDIWYASLEGAEAGAYVRGTASLNEGRGKIVLPDHFRHIASSNGITVILTPISIHSKGLAVIENDISDGIIEVGELLSGTGSYEFDWEVKAVRKGYEAYEVVRPKSYLQMNKGVESSGFYIDNEDRN